MRIARITPWLPQMLALCLALVLGACVKLEKQPLDKRYYALEVQRPATTPASVPPLSPETLLLRRLSTSTRIAGRELVYRTAPTAWTADYYNLFFVNPADMLTQDLRAWLNASGVFANVVDPGSLAPAPYLLEGNVTLLYGDLSAKPGQAVAEMQFLLLRNDGALRSVLVARGYTRRVPLSGSSPQELVRALREAVTEIYADLEADLRKALAKDR